MPAAVAISTLIAKVRARCRQPNASGFVSDDQIRELLVEGAYELYDMLILARGEEYYSTLYDFDTVAGQRLYPLPNDFYKLAAIAMSTTPTVGNGQAFWQEPIPFKAADLAYQEGITPGSPRELRYTLTGEQGTSLEVASTAQLRFYPAPPAAWTVRIVYLPTLMAPGAGEGITFDGINGWETFLVAHACITVGAMQEEDVGVWAAQKAEVAARVQRLAGNRDRAVPQQVADRRGSVRRGRTRWPERLPRP